MRMSCRQVLIRFATRGLLSRRTVSIPLQSILSCFSGLVQYNPAYLFLLINKYGKYTCQSEVNYKFHSVKVLFLPFRKSVKNKYACKLFPKELKNQKKKNPPFSQHYEMANKLVCPSSFHNPHIVVTNQVSNQ